MAVMFQHSLKLRTFYTGIFAVFFFLSCFAISTVFAQTPPTLYAVERRVPANVATKIELFGKSFQMGAENQYTLLVDSNQFNFGSIGGVFTSSTTAEIPMPAMGTIGPIKIALRTSSGTSNYLHVIVDRPNLMPDRPNAGASNSYMDRFWGMWKSFGAVLQQGKFSVLGTKEWLDYPASFYGYQCNAPSCDGTIMYFGYDTCGDLEFTNTSGNKRVALRGEQPSSSGLLTNACLGFPTLTNEWRSTITLTNTGLPPEDYLVRTKGARDNLYSNSIALRVLPNDSSMPPFLVSLDPTGAVEGFSQSMDPVRILGYNLQHASTMEFRGPTQATVAINRISNESATVQLPSLVPGRYRIYLNGSNGRSNSNYFDVYRNGSGLINNPDVLAVFDGPSGILYAKNANPDYYMLRQHSLTIPVNERLFRARNGFWIWSENLDGVSFTPKAGATHKILDKDKGQIEILNWNLTDTPPGKSGQLRNTYAHFTISPRGGSYQSKERLGIRSIYYIPYTTPRGYGFDEIWKTMHGGDTPEIIAMRNNKTSYHHLEFYGRSHYDGRINGQEFAVLTKPEIASYFAPPWDNKVMNVKVVWDFSLKVAQIFIQRIGIDPDYVDQTLPVSARITTPNGIHADFTNLENGLVDGFTEKRHPHRVLDPTQPDKSNFAAEVDTAIISAAPSQPIPIPTPLPIPSPTPNPTPGPSPTPGPTPVATPTPTPTSPPLQPVAVVELVVVNPANGNRITGLRDNGTLNLAFLPSKIDIAAITTGPAESVRFTTQGYTLPFDNEAPFLMSVDGNGFSIENLGEYTMTAAPFSGNNGSGTPGQSLTLRVNVINDPNTTPTPTPTPVPTAEPTPTPTQGPTDGKTEVVVPGSLKAKVFFGRSKGSFGMAIKLASRPFLARTVFSFVSVSGTNPATLIPLSNKTYTTVPIRVDEMTPHFASLAGQVTTGKDIYFTPLPSRKKLRKFARKLKKEYQKELSFSITAYIVDDTIASDLKPIIRSKVINIPIKRRQFRKRNVRRGFRVSPGAKQVTDKKTLKKDILETLNQIAAK